MLLRVFKDKAALGRAAAGQAATAIRRAIAERGRARIVAATAASQLEFLNALTKAPDIDWPKVEAFHLDEYIGLPATHPGSFRKMLMEGLVSKTGIVHYHLLEGDAADPLAVSREVGERLASAPLDVAFLGIGENGHIAFNDPPADFTTEDPYLLVNLDEASRRQQVGMVQRPLTGAAAREIDVAAPDSQGHRNTCHCSRSAQGEGSEGLPGGRDQPEGTGVDSAQAFECNCLFGRGLGLTAESGLAARAD